MAGLGPVWMVLCVAFGAFLLLIVAINLCLARKRSRKSIQSVGLGEVNGVKSSSKGALNIHALSKNLCYVVRGGGGGDGDGDGDGDEVDCVSAEKESSMKLSSAMVSEAMVKERRASKGPKLVLNGDVESIYGGAGAGAGAEAEAEAAAGGRGSKREVSASAI